MSTTNPQAGVIDPIVTTSPTMDPVPPEEQSSQWKKDLDAYHALY